MDIVMPKMGESVSEGTIIKWHKKPGDIVKRDEIIFEISTDKVDTEIPSPADGTLAEIFVNEGDTVAVGTVVAKISESGAAPAPVPQEKTSTAEKVVKENIKQPEPSNEVVNTQQQERTGKAEAPAAPASSGSMIEIAMPKMGESVMEGTIIKWYKKTGDAVKKDETIFEISTDKVDTEVPSPAEGILAEILVGEQETVEVGTVVAKLSVAGGVASSAQTTEVKEESPVSAGAMHDNFANMQPSFAEEEISGSGEVGFLSPLVLNIANKENVSFEELKRVKGTGQNGRITKKDILSYVEAKKRQPVQPQAAKPTAPAPVQEQKKTPAPAQAPSFDIPKTPQFQFSGEVERIPMDNIRQKIMYHMINSRDTSVHVTALIEVDMSKVHNFIQKNKDTYLAKEGVKLTYMAFIANACVKALKEYPFVNASIERNEIVVKKNVNLGIAVAMEPNGLIVPNIKNAGDKNVTGLARSINDLASRARNKKLSPDDITSGTFTITNYGVFGTIFGTPIINQPEVAILGVGAVVKKPVVVEADGTDTIAIKPILALTLSHDHRLVDGMLGGKFLKYIKDTLEAFDGNI